MTGRENAKCKMAIEKREVKFIGLSIFHFPFSILLLLFASCANFEEAGERPSSGVGADSPYDTLYLPNSGSVKFSGRAFDNTAVASVIYGVRYLPTGLEEAVAATPETGPLQFENQAFSTIDTFSLAVLDSVYFQAHYLPGRVQFYSQAKDVDGNLSDSLLSYKVVRDDIFPRFVMIEPSLVERFNPRQTSDSVIVRARPLQNGQTSIIAMTARMCRLLNTGRDTSLPKVQLRLSADLREYSGKVEVPPQASVGSLYRVEVTAIAQNGNIQRYLPGIEIRR